LRHREYFLSPTSTEMPHSNHELSSVGNVSYHGILLILYLVPLVILAKKIAVPIDYGIQVLKAPEALGGFLVAILILSPEALSAIRAAIANELQRAINILLGSVLASIGLTIPSVLMIGLITGQTIILGLRAVDTILLVLTLGVSALTFINNRTNVLQGAIHLLLFLAYLMLIFES
jgi:Ca2+:H+ antiporter